MAEAGPGDGEMISWETPGVCSSSVGSVSTLLFLLDSVCEVHVYMLVYASVCVDGSGCALGSAWQWRPEVQVERLVRRPLPSNSGLQHAFCRVRTHFVVVVVVENPECCLEYVNFKVPVTRECSVQTGRHVTCALVMF